MSEIKKRRSFFEEIEQGENRFTLDDPMGKLVKEAFELTKLAKNLNQNKMSEEILVYDVIFAIQDENGNFDLFQAPKKDFSHVSEYVEKKDLVPLKREYTSSQQFLEKLHIEWGENWDVIIDFFGQEVADEWDKIVGYED